MKSSAPRLASWRWAALFWGLFLFTLTSWPSPPSVPIVSAIPDFDKLVHFCLYGVEGFLLYRAVRWRGPAGFSFARVIAITAVMAVWGTIDEVHQMWIPGRSTEVGDVIADVCGAITGASVSSALSGRTRKKL